MTARVTALPIVPGKGALSPTDPYVIEYDMLFEKIRIVLENKSQRSFSHEHNIPPPDFSRWRRNHPKNGWGQGKCSQGNHARVQATLRAWHKAIEGQAQGDEAKTDTSPATIMM